MKASHPTTRVAVARLEPVGLTSCVTQIFQAVGVSADDSSIVADALVTAEMRGVVTHGVSNLAPKYLSWIETGFVNPRPRWRVTRGAAAVLNVDGDRGLGLVVAAQVMSEVIDRARESGIAFATVHNSRHLGMAGYHAMLALDHDMIGVCMTAVPAAMVPTFGREPRLGTNPIAVAVPSGAEPPFVFDAATTTVASNKLKLALHDRRAMAPGTMVDRDGHVVAESVVPEEPFRLSPLGGTSEGSSHKGYGLAVVVDVLSAVLSHGSFGARFPAGVAAHSLSAINVDALLPIDEFKSAMDAYLRMLKATPPEEGQAEVLVAGQLEDRAFTANARAGVPITLATIDWLSACADRFGLKQPIVVSPTP